ncbi:MAG TPA: hypothetical protein VG694_03310 [Candidatus Paceibacterota bacterium]|nr:hypothetical protein [Candidatus Paceibacterota bacterium]
MPQETFNTIKRRVDEEIKKLDEERDSLGEGLNEDIEPEKLNEILDKRYELNKKISSLRMERNIKEHEARFGDATKKDSGRKIWTDFAEKIKFWKGNGTEAEPKTQETRASEEKVEETQDKVIIPAERAEKAAEPQKEKSEGGPKIEATIQPEEEKKPQELGETVDKFLKRYGLDDRVPERFKSLSEEQKLFVIQNLQKRMLDIVTEGAETQYSDYIKKKMASETDPKSKLHAFIKAIKKAPKSAGEAWKKESEMQRLRQEAFAELINTDEGKKLVDEDMARLTDGIKDYRVYHDKTDNTVKYYYLNVMNFNRYEEDTVLRFNKAANAFREIPWEWSQQKRRPKWMKLIDEGKRRKYEKAKKEYEDARNDVLYIKTQKETEKGKAIEEMGRIDGFIQWQQLSNTHPEFEKEMEDISRGPGRKENLKTLGKLGNILTLKNNTNRALVAAGFLARRGVRGAAAASQLNILAYAGTAAVGGVVGGIRGRIRAMEELKKKSKEARYGKNRVATGKIAMNISQLRKQLEEARKNGDKNGAKKIRKSIDEQERQRSLRRKGELGSVVDVAHLTRRFETLTAELEGSFVEDPAEEFMEPEERKKIKEQKEKRLALLVASIEHAQGKIERGEVNFGDAKSIMANQFNFVSSLNKAMVLKESLADKNNREIKKKIDNLISSRAKSIKSGMEEERKKFISKQIKKGVLVGAGAATLGYVLRYVMEGMPGMFEHHHAEHLLNNGAGELGKGATENTHTIGEAGSHIEQSTEPENLNSGGAELGKGIGGDTHALENAGHHNIEQQVQHSNSKGVEKIARHGNYQNEENSEKITKEFGKKTAKMHVGGHGDLEHSSQVHSHSTESHAGHGKHSDLAEKKASSTEKTPQQNATSRTNNAVENKYDIRGSHDATGNKNAGSITNSYSRGPQIIDNNNNLYDPGTRINGYLNYQHVFGENPYHLSRHLLNQSGRIYERSIRKIFENPRIEWTRIMNNPVQITGVDIPNPQNDYEVFSNYLNWLHRTTGLEPMIGNFGQTQSNLEYVWHAIEKAASEGKLDDLKP